MHSQPTGTGTPEFPVISSRLWKSEPLAALDPYSSALSFISNIPIICSWESSEVSPPQSSLKPNSSNVFSDSLLFHNFNQTLSGLEIPLKNWKISASCDQPWPCDLSQFRLYQSTEAAAAAVSVRARRAAAANNRQSQLPTRPGRSPNPLRDL